MTETINQQGVASDELVRTTYRRGRTAIVVKLGGPFTQAEAVAFLNSVHGGAR
jgi:hypothetical protein